MAPRLLIVEDEEDGRAVVGRKFGTEGYEVLEAETGAEGLRMIATERPDVILLDIRLPDIDGVSVCGEARHITDVPILMLTAESAPETAVRALDPGADDYIPKPVDLGELVARVRVALRATAEAAVPEGAVEVGPLTIDEFESLVTYDGTDIGASATETMLLAHMARNAGKPLSREYLVDALWGGDRDPHLIEVHVSNLRRKLRDAGSRERLIRPVPGSGYRLDAPRAPNG